MLLVDPAEPGNAKWEFHPALYASGVQFHSQFWVTLGWHGLGCGGALSRGFPNEKCALGFPWGLPGEGWLLWGVISWCQSLRRVLKRTPPHSCVHPVASCCCLVLNI